MSTFYLKSSLTKMAFKFVFVNLNQITLVQYLTSTTTLVNGIKLNKKKKACYTCLCGLGKLGKLLNNNNMKDSKFNLISSYKSPIVNPTTMVTPGPGHLYLFDFDGTLARERTYRQDMVDFTYKPNIIEAIAKFDKQATPETDALSFIEEKHDLIDQHYHPFGDQKRLQELKNMFKRIRSEPSEDGLNHNEIHIITRNYTFYVRYLLKYFGLSKFVNSVIGQVKINAKSSFTNPNPKLTSLRLSCDRDINSFKQTTSITGKTRVNKGSVILSLYREWRNRVQKRSESKETKPEEVYESVDFINRVSYYDDSNAEHQDIVKYLQEDSDFQLSNSGIDGMNSQFTNIILSRMSKNPLSKKPLTYLDVTLRDICVSKKENLDVEAEIKGPEGLKWEIN